ncbi:MAG: PrsW family intramembrane metalloprotease [archaeon]
MRARNVLRIARWEVTKNAGGIDRRTAAITVGALIVLGMLAPLIASGGVALDTGLYRVGVDQSSSYSDVLEEDETLTIVEPDPKAVETGRADVLIEENQGIEVADTSKGQAALEELRGSVEAYNDRLMERQDNRTAAFPVSVSITYVDRSLDQESPAVTEETTSEENDSNTVSDSTGGETGGTDGRTVQTGERTEDGETSDDDDSEGAIGIPGGIGGGFGSPGGSTGAPSDIAPPFPFGSLVLAFVFVLPLNFVIQAYGSTILGERIKRRGELMLVSPVSRGDIIVGKTLPYFMAAMAFEGLITAGLLVVGPTDSSGWISVLAMTPLVVLFLGATFLAAMFARSFKELTFLTVTITVGLTSYAFVPAIFTDVTPIALISPLTIVVRDIQGQTIEAVEFVFSTLPPLLTAAVTFGLGAGLYREEDMFTQRPISLKALDALSGRIKRRASAAKLSAILLPFVFVTELIAVAMLFAVPESVAIPAILLVVAVVEELAKSVHVYAGFLHRKYDRTIQTALVVGALSGFGFFLAEKLTLLVQLVGSDLPKVEEAAFVTGGTSAAVSAALAVALLIAPLLLHAVTATVSAIGASRSRRDYLLGLAVAIVLHLGYNLTVVSVVVR